MAKVVVKETVTNSVELDARQVNIERDTIRCFQLLEEERWDEAHNIIETILNIDPCCTDIHIANFLYQFRCGRINWLDYNRYNDYLRSVFYQRIYNSTQTSLRAQFMSRISELQRAFGAKTEKKHKALRAEIEKAFEVDTEKRHEGNSRSDVAVGVLLAFTAVVFALLFFIIGEKGGGFLVVSVGFICILLSWARDIYCKNKQMRK